MFIAQKNFLKISSGFYNLIQYRKQYFSSFGEKITKPIAEILLEMANYLEAKIIIDDKKEFISLEQLD